MISMRESCSHFYSPYCLGRFEARRTTKMDEHKHTQHTHIYYISEVPKDKRSARRARPFRAIIWPRHSRLLPNPSLKSPPHIITSVHKNKNRSRPLPMVTNNMNSTWRTTCPGIAPLGMPATTKRWWQITGNVFGSCCC